MGIIAGFLAMLGWGTGDFLGAILSRRIGHLLTVFWMQITGFLFAVIYFGTNLKFFNFSDAIKFLPVIAICGFLEVIAYLAFYKGFEEGQVSLVSPIGSSWPVLTIIFGLVFLKETLLTNQIIAIVLIFFGLILISINIKEIRQRKWVISKGVKEGIIAMVGWGILFFLLTGPSRALGWFLPVLIFRFFTILFLLPFIFRNKNSNEIFPRFYLAPLIIIGLLDVGAFFAYTFGIRGEQVSIVAPIIAAFPLVTVALAKIFLKEKLLLNHILGIISTIVGLILISIK